MPDNSSSNKRIAKNSIFMSIRMVFVLCITLYTTRVILNILGVEDYGVYNVVCGFVSMFTFLNTSMSNGIQRFYNFELGKNSVEGANRVYNTALVIQIILSLIIIALTESFGIWYLHNKMVIPADRMSAAEWIFQFSIISFLFVIMQAPYTAAVIAHERMDFYAIISVLDAILKLAIVLAIPLFHGDNLIVYGILYSLISVLNFVSYFLYCKFNFTEIKARLFFDKDLYKSMLGFSGWNIFGTFGGIVKEQGLNLVLNFFFGPVVNAARGIAAQITGGLQSFVSNITIPVRPQVTQSYASGDVDRMMRLTYSVSKLSCCFLYLIALPIMIEIGFVLKIWLGDNVPDHTSYFAIIVILNAFINNLNSAISGVVHSSGKMKKYQLVGCTFNLLTLPVSYIVLLCGARPEWALVVNLIMTIIMQFAVLIVTQQIVYFKLTTYFKEAILPVLQLIGCSFIWPLIPRFFIEESLFRFLITTLCSIIPVSFCLYYFVLNSSEKRIVDNMVRGLVSKKSK